MPMTGDLLQAARVLTGVSIEDLAAKAGLPPKVVGSLEDRGEAEVDVGSVTPADEQVLTRLRRALEGAGVEFLEGGTPGVRLRPSAANGELEEGLPVDEITAQNDI